MPEELMCNEKLLPIALHWDTLVTLFLIWLTGVAATRRISCR